MKKIPRFHGITGILPITIPASVESVNLQQNFENDYIHTRSENHGQLSTIFRPIKHFGHYRCTIVVIYRDMNFHIMIRMYEV